jgi:hypothetical protein
LIRISINSIIYGIIKLLGIKTPYNLWKNLPYAKNQRIGKSFTDAPGSDVEPGVFGP